MLIADIKLVFLVTDILLFLLLAMAISYFIYARKHEHLFAPWRYLARSSIAMGTGAILLSYLAIALIDSIHFQQKIHLNQGDTQQAHYSQTKSVLDLWLQPLQDRSEKSYSAPFASQLYVKENIEREDGSTFRDFPQLRHGGQHLTAHESKILDVIQRSFPGIGIGLFLGALLLVLIAIKVCFSQKIPIQDSLQQIILGKTKTRWRVFVLTFTGLFIVGGITAELSQVYHILGTDKIGESVLYQAIKSIRTGIIIGTLTTLVMLPFAIIMGIAAGYFRGWVDDVIQYIYTTLNSIPGLLLIASAILMLQVHMSNNADSYASLLERSDLRLVFLCMILGITSWTGLCRYLRAESLKLREMDYIAAARTMGVSHTRILGRHILPNVMHLVLITVVLDFSGLVLAEAVLAYVQIGVDPTTESWGNMINSARLEMAREPAVWWSLVAAFIFMLVLVLAANLFADVVRDALDPKSSHQHR